MPLGASENDSSRMKGNSHVQFEFNPSTSITLEGETKENLEATIKQKVPP
jgi:hypothetical protein